MARGRRLLIAALVTLASGSAVAGAVVGAGVDGARSPRQAEGGAGASFLNGIVPRPAERRERRDAPAAPAGGSRLARALPLERKVAQLFLFGFEGTDLNSEIFQRLRRLDLGGIVLERRNYTTSDLLGQMAGEAGVIAEQEAHLRPWVLASQQGGELNAFPDLPPATAPADLLSAGGAGAEAAEAAHALRDLGISGVLGPALDVGFEGGSALGAATYSDDPAEVAGFADAVLAAYREAGLFAAVEHFPGLGSADQSTDEGPASVGLDLAQLRRRDLLPFRAAFEDRVPGVVLSNALYPINDFTAPASLSRQVVRDLLRGELGFEGVAITDDLAAPAVGVAAPVPQAAVLALRAGADMLFVSGDATDQQAAYETVLAAARSGRVPRARLDQAVGRILAAKKDYGLLE